MNSEHLLETGVNSGEFVQEECEHTQALDTALDAFIRAAMDLKLAHFPDQPSLISNVEQIWEDQGQAYLVQVGLNLIPAHLEVITNGPDDT